MKNRLLLLSVLAALLPLPALSHEGDTPAGRLGKVSFPNSQSDIQR